MPIDTKVEQFMNEVYMNNYKMCDATSFQVGRLIHSRSFHSAWGLLAKNRTLSVLERYFVARLFDKKGLIHHEY